MISNTYTYTTDCGSLYSRVLGPSFHRLAPVLAQLHSGGEQRLHGVLRVRVGSRPLVRVLMWLTRRPQSCVAANCNIWIVPRRGSERWQRQMGNLPMTSLQDFGGEHEIIERFGPLAIHLHCWIVKGSLWLRSRRTTLFGLTLPALLGLQVVARERPIAAQRLRCDVRLRSSLLGCLLHYCGTLELEH